MVGYYSFDVDILKRIIISNIEVEKSINFCSGKLDEYGKEMDLLFFKVKLLKDNVRDFDKKYINF